jgi:pimeloyl-ACP methyl ester carboxylesterase
MYHLRPDYTNAIVLCGTGWRESKDYVAERIDSYRTRGIDFRFDYTLEDFSPQFRSTPMGRWFAQLFSERNPHADLDTIIAMFEALGAPDPEDLHRELAAPVLILSGTQDKAHASAFALRERLPAATLIPVQGAGHACHIERPWTFDAEVIRFLREHGHALPGNSDPVSSAMP